MRKTLARDPSRVFDIGGEEYEINIGEDDDGVQFLGAFRGGVPVVRVPLDSRGLNVSVESFTAQLNEVAGKRLPAQGSAGAETRLKKIKFSNGRFRELP